MAFIVDAKSDNFSSGSFRAEKETRKDAVLTAVELMGQGVIDVTITDDKGPVFNHAQFPIFFNGGTR